MQRMGPQDLGNAQPFLSPFFDFDSIGQSIQALPQWDQRPIADAIVPQTLALPDIDQGPSDNKEERQWDQTPRYWSDTALGQWAIEANRWDGIDPIPPDEEPVFYAD